MTEGKIMFGNRKIKNQQPSPYATRGDFCRIFENDMNRLYRLSFLLTGDHAMAEQCFVGGLHIAHKGNQVFKEWADSWARRAIILNAIRMIRPRMVRPGMVRPLATSGIQSAGPERSAGKTTEPADMAEIVELPAFERFAFVMSVLEHYTDQECSLLLDCRRGDVTAARSRALDRMGRAAELQGNIVSIGSDKPRMLDDLESRLQREVFADLAASA
jgi:DNA-directed RNA polymerase specialized sigma24 family protein